MSRLEDWGALIASDPAALVFVAAVVGLIAILITALVAATARRRRARRLEAAWRTAPDDAGDQPGIARWVEEGRHLLDHWQERIERLDALQARLAAMAQEIGQLKAQASRVEAVQAENLRLTQERDALVLERDQVRAVLARIGELIQQATEARPRTARAEDPGAAP